MTDVQERMSNLASCCADAAAEGANAINSEERYVVVVSIRRYGDDQTIAESFQTTMTPQPIASRKAHEERTVRDWNGELYTDEYAPANTCGEAA